jgi:hypothetical protein
MANSTGQHIPTIQGVVFTLIPNLGDETTFTLKREGKDIGTYTMPQLEALHQFTGVAWMLINNPAGLTPVDIEYIDETETF